MNISLINRFTSLYLADDNSESTSVDEIEISLSKNDYFKCKSIDGLTKAEWELSTVTSSFINGDKVNNRIAKSRIITVQLEIKDCADFEEGLTWLNNFFSKYGTISVNKQSDEKVYILKWDNNGEIRYINCSLESIDALHFGKSPIVEIVFHADSYWYGEKETIYATEYTDYWGDTYMVFDVTCKGNVSVPIYINALIDEVKADNSTEITLQAEIPSEEHSNSILSKITAGYAYRNSISKNNTVPWDSIIFNSIVGNKNFYQNTPENFTTQINYSINSLLPNITSGTFFQLAPGMRQVIKILANDSDVLLKEYSYNGYRYSYDRQSYLTYTPLYI